MLGSVRRFRQTVLPVLLALALAASCSAGGPAGDDVESPNDEAQAPTAGDEAGPDNDSLVRGRVERPVPEGLPPPAPVFVPAEWEPALGAIVRWPLEVPDELVREIAEDDTLYVLVREEEVADARAGLAVLGVPEVATELIPAPVESPWPRDYGPHQVFDGEGRLAVLDAVFAGWPRFPAEWQAGSPREPRTSWWSGPGDDDVPLAVGEHLGVPVYRFPGFLTGGNFLVDGRGTAFATQAQVDENLPLFDPDAFTAALGDYAGIQRFHVLPNTEGMGIQHIDTWLKVLDPERLLVMRAPAGHPEEARIDRALEILRGLRTPFGGRYEIQRIDAAEMRGPRGDSGTAPYTNSLILNRKVLVPLFGLDTDGPALETWRAAMPGYEVVGFPYDGWMSFDALHCRTRAVFDDGMLRVAHARLRDGTPVRDRGLRVLVEIDDRSRAGLVEGELVVRYRAVYEAGWRRQPLVPTEVVDLYDRGGGPRDGKDALLRPLRLTAQEKSDLVAFLRSLSGDPVTVERPSRPDYELRTLGRN